MILSPDCTTSLQSAVGVASAHFSATMAANTYWLFTSSTNCWIKQGAGTPTASAAAGSMYVPANVTVLLDGALGANLAVIRDTADGKASLTMVKRF